jgi:hypothetical protein
LLHCIAFRVESQYIPWLSSARQLIYLPIFGIRPP